MAELKRNYNEIITVSEHNHPGGAQFDAVAPAAEYMKAAVNCGYKKFAVTDHGSFTAMQSCYDAIKALKLDLEIIYGVEAYVEIPGVNIDDAVSHVIMMATDEEGKHIIDKLNSYAGAARKDCPVITWEQLESVKFNGHVIATSACVAGPAGYWLLSDRKVLKRINSWEAKLFKADEEGNLPIAADSEEALTATKQLSDVQAEIDAMIADRDSGRHKAIIRKANKEARDCKAKGDEKGMRLAADKATAANDELTQLKSDIAAKKKALKDLKSSLSPIFDRVNRYNEINEKIEELEKELLPEEEKIDKAKEILARYDVLFGHGNFYAEVQYHGLEMEKYVYPVVAKIAAELEIPLVAANDAHMPDKSEKWLHARQVAKFLRFKKYEEPNAADAELYIKTPNELAEALVEILSPEQMDEAMMNLNAIGERCHYIPKRVAHYPVFDKNQDGNSLLADSITTGKALRISEGLEWTETYEDRIKYEYGVIKSMGFSDYFLIVKDFMEYAAVIGNIPVELLPEVPLTIEAAKAYCEEHGFDCGVGTGVGRGSGAGSLILFCLGVTGIDPIKYDLPFERFLNPERVSMPDIDSDIAPFVREKTIDYVREKYGNMAVVGIVTEQRVGVKNGIRDCARYLSCKRTDNENPTKFLKLGDTICKSVPENPNISFVTETKDGTLFDTLLKAYSANPDAIKIIKMAKDCEGMLRGYGQHAAGVIIYDSSDITDYIPVRNGKAGLQTEMDMIQCEAQGLLKMDFLGLKTLPIITDTIRMVKEKTGKNIDIKNLDPNGTDSIPVYENIYAKGRTKDIFQMESAGMRSYLKQLFSTE